MLVPVLLKTRMLDSSGSHPVGSVIFLQAHLAGVHEAKGRCRRISPEEAAALSGGQGSADGGKVDAPPAPDVTGPEGLPESAPEPKPGFVMILVPNPADRRGLKCHDVERGLCECSEATAAKKIGEGVARKAVE